MREPIVINASPLILLCKAELHFILPALFSEIFVPTAVMDEIAENRQDGVAERIREQSAFRVVDAPSEPLVQAWDLGRGETNVISYAYHNRAYVAVLDDSAAKACCQAFGLRTLGTGSVLIRAKQHGLIPSVGDALMLLRRKGMWISDSVIHLLCTKAGESAP